MLKHYLRLIIFTSSLLLAIQVPSFIDQYSLISKARYAEAQQNLSGFQETADQFFGGSLEKLIVYYQQKNDAVINADGVNIDKIYQRVALLKQENQILEQAQYQIAWHLLTTPNADIMTQAQQEYNYTVPLNINAISWGVGLSVIAIGLVDFTLFVLQMSGVHLIRVFRRANPTAKAKANANANANE